jgi:hypothetical protein
MSSCSKPEEIDVTQTNTCINTENVFSTTFSGKKYEFIKERKNWRDAAECAIERGGYLVEINDANEQNNMYSLAVNNISDISLIVAPDIGDGS